MRKSMKSKLKRYTAFVPKTLKATKNVGKSTVKKINYFLRKTVKTVKKTTKMLDGRTAKTIRSLTKRRR
jgi:ERCC4-type nuclease